MRKYVINRYADQVARLDEIMFCEYVCIADHHPHNWLIVFMRDGRKLESELLKNQPDLELLMTKLHLDGVRIYKRACKEVAHATH